MARQDTTDFLTAFAVGAVLGIGATLLLRGGELGPPAGDGGQLVDGPAGMAETASRYLRNRRAGLCFF